MLIDKRIITMQVFILILVSIISLSLMQPAVAASDTAPSVGDNTNTPVRSPTPPESKASEKVHNPYGLDASWRSGDIVSRSTLIILVVMSIGSWTILVMRLIEQNKLFRQANEATQRLGAGASVQADISKLGKESVFRFIAQTAVEAYKDHTGPVTKSIDLNTWVTLSIQRAVETIQNGLQGGLAFLATIASTAPFVGLFGTVWGIYHALTAIGIAGQASIDKVAGPVGEALIMTALGLAVAVPAVMGHNWIVRRNKCIMDRVRTFSSEVHAILFSGSKGQSTAAEKAGA